MLELLALATILGALASEERFDLDAALRKTGFRSREEARAVLRAAEDPWGLLDRPEDERYLPELTRVLQDPNVLRPSTILLQGGMFSPSSGDAIYQRLSVVLKESERQMKLLEARDPSTITDDEYIAFDALEAEVEDLMSVANDLEDHRGTGEEAGEVSVDRVLQVAAIAARGFQEPGASYQSRYFFDEEDKMMQLRGALRSVLETEMPFAEAEARVSALSDVEVEDAIRETWLPYQQIWLRLAMDRQERLEKQYEMATSLDETVWAVWQLALIRAMKIPAEARTALGYSGPDPKEILEGEREKRAFSR